MQIYDFLNAYLRRIQAAVALIKYDCWNQEFLHCALYTLHTYNTNNVARMGVGSFSENLQTPPLQFCPGWLMCEKVCGSVCSFEYILKSWVGVGAFYYFSLCFAGFKCRYKSELSEFCSCLV